MMQNLPFVLLISAAVGGLAWVFLYPILSGEKKVEQRKQSVVRAGAAAPARAARTAQKPRREQVESALKEVEERRAKSNTLSARIAQAGLSWSKQRFFITCGAVGLVGF